MIKLRLTILEKDYENSDNNGQSSLQYTKQIIKVFFFLIIHTNF